MTASDEKDRYGDKMSLLERARENLCDSASHVKNRVGIQAILAERLDGLVGGHNQELDLASARLAFHFLHHGE